MKLLLSFCLVFSLVLISCSTNNVEDINYKNLFPTKVANNWVYQLTVLDSNANIVSENQKDSLAIISQKEIDGRKSYLLAFYRANGAIDSAYLSTKSFEIELYSKKLKPFNVLSELDTCNCSKERWNTIFSDIKIMWEQKDSLKSEYITLGEGIYSPKLKIEISNTLKHQMQMRQDTTIEFQGKKYIAKKAKIFSNYIKKLLGDNEARFVVKPGFRYSDDYKTIYASESELNVFLIDGIGMVYFEEYIKEGTQIFHKKYNLIKYELY